jgi:uncharacterized membrane protein YccC
MRVSGLPHGLLALVTPDLRQLSLLEGLRAALATAAVVALSAWLHSPGLGEAALAAMLTCLADSSGPVRRRVPALLAYVGLGALLTGGFALLRGHAPLPVVIVAACATLFCSAFARVHGQAAQQVGNLLTVTVVLALTRSLTDPLQAAGLAVAFVAGGLWATLLTLVIWRLHPYGPARRALADIWRTMADLATDMRGLLLRPDTSREEWDAHARTHRRAVRDAIERARTAVMTTMRARGPVSGRAAQTLIRLENADQAFRAMIALSEELAAHRDPAAWRAGERVLRLLRPVMLMVAQDIESDTPSRPGRLDRIADEIAEQAQDAPSLRAAAEALADRLRVAETLSAPEGWQPGTPADQTRAAFWHGVVSRTRANLNWQSEALRHALRVVVAAAPAFAITLYWPTSYGHWMTIMLVMTLQPYVALTYARALERAGGSVLGGVIAAAIAVVCTTPVSIAIALFPLAAIGFALRPVSFGAFITGLTPLVVLLSELGRPGESEFMLAAMRALYALIGSGIAVAAVLVLWPSWEPGRISAGLHAAVRAHAAYAQAELASLLGEASEEVVEQARRAAGVASNNLEASLQRALLEPRGAGATAGPALTVDAALRRIAGRLSAMHVTGTAGRDRAAWHAWSDWIGECGARLADGRIDLPPRPKLPEGDPQAPALARIARQWEVVAGALVPPPGAS